MNWCLDFWIPFDSKTFQLGIYHKPACASPFAPRFLRYRRRVLLRVCRKGVEMVGDGGAGGLVRDPQSQ